jgi:hypothetical protein
VQAQDSATRAGVERIVKAFDAVELPTEPASYIRLRRAEGADRFLIARELSMHNFPVPTGHREWTPAAVAEAEDVSV